MNRDKVLDLFYVIFVGLVIFSSFFFLWKTSYYFFAERTLEFSKQISAIQEVNLKLERINMSLLGISNEIEKKERVILIKEEKKVEPTKKQVKPKSKPKMVDTKPTDVKTQVTKPVIKPVTKPVTAKPVPIKPSGIKKDISKEKAKSEPCPK